MNSALIDTISVMECVRLSILHAKPGIPKDIASLVTLDIPAERRRDRVERSRLPQRCPICRITNSFVKASKELPALPASSVISSAVDIACQSAIYVKLLTLSSASAPAATTATTLLTDLASCPNPFPTQTRTA